MPLQSENSTPAVVPGYYLVCYNVYFAEGLAPTAVVPGYYLVCYNFWLHPLFLGPAVVPGYYLVCYNNIARKQHWQQL